MGDSRLRREEKISGRGPSKKPGGRAHGEQK